jgi:polysaccharide deacetylase 2 family uncharacterized protein YibQ
MFSRRPLAATPASTDNLSQEASALLSRLTNPYIGAAAAGTIVLLTAVVLVLFGDPHAGAPSVRIPLAGPSAKDIGALHAPQPAAIDLTSLQPGQEVSPDGALAGQAEITLPQGGAVSGGSGADATSIDPSSPDAAPPRPQSPPLPVAPLTGFSAPGPDGPVPVIARDGRTPAQVYARPFKDQGKPRVALVIGGLGLNAAATKSAIERLPPEVTLSFVPYADNLQGWIDLARANGHEVLLEVPMEPTDYPNNDPGPQTLMANGAPSDMLKRMNWLLGRASGYFGVTNYLGGRFLASAAATSNFVAVLRAHGLAFIDDGSAANKGGGVPRAWANAVVDQTLSAEAISSALTGLEVQARQHGSALGSGFAYPVTVDQVDTWAQALGAHNIQLVPASAVLHRT